MMTKIYSLLVFFSLILSVGAKKQPNFLFIIVDDQSPLDLLLNPSPSGSSVLDDKLNLLTAID